jgi:hypothetical protein
MMGGTQRITNGDFRVTIWAIWELQTWELQNPILGQLSRNGHLLPCLSHEGYDISTLHPFCRSGRTGQCTWKLDVDKFSIVVDKFSTTRAPDRLHPESGYGRTV